MRQIDGYLPTAEVAFIDEIFKVGGRHLKPHNPARPASLAHLLQPLAGLPKPAYHAACSGVKLQFC